MNVGMKIKAIEIITTEQGRKAFLHPLRSKMLNMLTLRPMTITQVAQEMGVHPANLTHHFRKLQSAGLIKVHEERGVGRVVERHYIAKARAFEIRQDTSSANAKVLSFLRNDLSASIAKMKPDDSDPLIGLLKISRIDKSMFKEFAKKLEDLVEDFASRSQDGQPVYALNVSLYPHLDDYGPLKEIQIKRKKKSE